MWNPEPLDTSAVELPPEVLELVEVLADQAHMVWGRRRLDQGWRHGDAINELTKTHTRLVPYDELPEEAKDDDRKLALQTIKVLFALGYTIVPGRPAATATIVEGPTAAG